MTRRRITGWFVGLTAAMLLLAPCAAGAADGGNAGRTVVGTVPALLQGVSDRGSRLSSTSLGSAAADAVRDAAKSQFAIVNGGDILHNLEGGEATEEDIRRVFAEDKTLAVASVSAKQLKEMLEIAVGELVTGEDDAIDQSQSRFDGFAQPAGLSFDCDASAPAGMRITAIRFLESGEELELTDDSAMYTVAATEYMLSGGYGMPPVEYEVLDATLVSALEDAVRQGRLHESYSDRVNIYGVADDRLIQKVPFLLLVLAAVLIGSFRYQSIKTDTSRRNYRNEIGYRKK